MGPGGPPGWGSPQGPGDQPMPGPGGPREWGPPQGPGAQLMPAPGGPSGFVGSFYNFIDSCLSLFCCCWLLQDCFGRPMGPSRPAGPYGPPPP